MPLARGEKLAPEASDALDLAIKRKKISGKTDGEIATEHGVSRGTVAGRRRRMRDDIQPAADRVQARQAARGATSLNEMLLTLNGEIEDVEGERLKEMLAALPVLSAGERMRALSLMISETEDQRTKVAAIALLDKLEAQHAPAATAGPAPPLTDDEKVERLVRLFQPLSRDLIDRALNEVWSDSRKELVSPAVKPEISPIDVVNTHDPTTCSLPEKPE